MPVTFPSNVTTTYKLASRHGAPIDLVGDFDTELNSFLALGWRIINSYIEREENGSDECICLLGWMGDGDPQYPDHHVP